MTEHTLGPWTVRMIGINHDHHVITSSLHDVAEIRHNGNGAAHENANARLIAAAPELLEALHTIATSHMPRSSDNTGHTHGGLRAIAIAAIAKATGEA